MTSHILGRGDKRNHQGRHVALMLLLFNLNKSYKIVVILVVDVFLFTA